MFTIKLFLSLLAIWSRDKLIIVFIKYKEIHNHFVQEITTTSCPVAVQGHFGFEVEYANIRGCVATDIAVALFKKPYNSI